jgi:DNA-binding NarL/FixJ family response regulator
MPSDPENSPAPFDRATKALLKRWKALNTSRRLSAPQLLRSLMKSNVPPVLRRSNEQPKSASTAVQTLVLRIWPRAEGVKLGRKRLFFDRSKVWRLKDQGHSIRDIAATLKLSHGTVQRVIQARM